MPLLVSAHHGRRSGQGEQCLGDRSRVDQLVEVSGVEGARRPAARPRRRRVRVICGAEPEIGARCVRPIRDQWQGFCEEGERARAQFGQGRRASGRIGDEGTERGVVPVGITRARSQFGMQGDGEARDGLRDLVQATASGVWQARIGEDVATDRAAPRLSDRREERPRAAVRDEERTSVGRQIRQRRRRCGGVLPPVRQRRVAIAERRDRRRDASPPERRRDRFPGGRAAERAGDQDEVRRHRSTTSSIRSADRVMRESARRRSVSR